MRSELSISQSDLLAIVVMAAKRTETFHPQHFFVGPSNIDSSDTDEHDEIDSVDGDPDEVDVAANRPLATRLTRM